MAHPLSNPNSLLAPFFWYRICHRLLGRLAASPDEGSDHPGAQVRVLRIRLSYIVGRLVMGVSGFDDGLPFATVVVYGPALWLNSESEYLSHVFLEDFCLVSNIYLVYVNLTNRYFRH